MRWIWVWVLTIASVVGALEPNLLTNGGMEMDANCDGLADGWMAEVHRQEGGEGLFALDPQVKVKGKFSQRIVHTSERGWVRASQMDIPAQPHARYLFRCWVKADCRFLLIVYAFRNSDRYDTFVIAQGMGTTGGEWQLFSGIFRTPADARSFKVSLITDSKGTAWFDEAELILLERPPYALVPVVKEAPKLDGDLSDPIWQRAEPLTPFIALGMEKVAEPVTVAKVLATPTHLFVAFWCAEPNPKAMRLRTQESGEPAYRDECVEVYLDPEHRHDGFYQFVVTPKGNRWSQRITSARWAQVWWLLPRPTWQIGLDNWQAAARIGENFWSAEIAIPFPLLGLSPKTGTTIGSNLCRSRKGEQTEQNSAFAYLTTQPTFQRPERFPHILLQGIGDMVGAASAAKIRKEKTKPWIASPQPLVPNFSIVPKPQRILLRDQKVVLTTQAKIVLPSGATALERVAAELLMDTLRKVGILAGRETSGDIAESRSDFVLTTFDRIPVSVRPLLPLRDLRTFFAQRGEEAYVLFVGTGGKGQRTSLGNGDTEKRGHRKARNNLSASIVLVGASAKGVFNGVQTLRQLLWLNAPPLEAVTDERVAFTLPACEIWDYPDLKLRGWHIIAPLRHELPFALKLLHWLALQKFNTLVVEVDDRFPYERHPSIVHPQAMTREQWQQFLDEAKRLGFEVIPQVQTFGHFGYVLNKPEYRHLSELTEPHPRWGFFAYCPSNPDTYLVVFDLFDEVLSVFRPRWFHIGHDEITFVPIGVCERCKATGKTAWQLLAEDIRRLYDFLKAKGVERVAMWCDQLEPDRTGGYAPFFTHFAADLLPKDIVQFCWHYDARQTFPWLTRLKDKGFDVVACGWYHAQNVWRFAAEGFDRRALGYCGTTWYGVTGFATAVDLMTAVVLGAQNSWSVDNPPIERAPHPTNLAQDLWALVGERRRWREGVQCFLCLDLGPLTNSPLFGRGGIVPEKQSVGAALAAKIGEGSRKGKGESLSGGEIVIWEGVPFRLAVPPLSVVALSSADTPHEVAPDLVTIAIGAPAKSLYLLMTTTARPIRTEDLYERGRVDPRKVATLLVQYADGTEVREELHYRQHLTEWNDRLGGSHARLVWQGKTANGSLVTLCAFEWRNPHPDLPIASVSLLSAGGVVQPVLVALTVGLGVERSLP